MYLVLGYALLAYGLFSYSRCGLYGYVTPGGERAGNTFNHANRSQLYLARGGLPHDITVSLSVPFQ